MTSSAEKSGTTGGCAEGAVALTTGEMARMTGSTLRTVRYYEEAGLLAPTSRTECGNRSYSEADLTKLQLILDLREAGLSIQDIRSLFDLKSVCGGAGSASRQMASILERKIDEMQTKIAKLRCLREELASTVSVIEECRSCDHPSFPGRCCDCEVLGRSDLPRAVKLLWKS